MVQVTTPDDGVRAPLFSEYLVVAARFERAPAAVVAPVPPFAIATVPVTFPALPEMSPEMSEPGMEDTEVTAPVPLPVRYSPEARVAAPVPP